MNQNETKLPLNITFEIKDGTIYYLGEIEINLKEKKVTVINKIERDRIKFKEKNSEMIF